MRGCQCTPGTEENGWHEVRCEKCLRKERQELLEAMHRFRVIHQEEWVRRARQRLAGK